MLVVGALLLGTLLHPLASVLAVALLLVLALAAGVLGLMCYRRAAQQANTDLATAGHDWREIELGEDRSMSTYTTPHGTSHLHVAVDGTITRPKPIQPGTDGEPPVSAPEQTSSTDDAPVTDSPVEWAPGAVHGPASPQNTPTESEARQPQAAAGSPTDAHLVLPELAEAPEQTAPADPRWDAIAQQPATQGIRGTLNSLGLTLAPAAAEIAERRTTYDQERAEAEQQRLEQEAAAQREAEMARHHQEQQTRREARRRAEDKREREQRRIIQTNFQGARTILVANQKGGARKTTTTYLVGATLGIIRGGGVIEGSRLGTLDRFVRNQGDSHFDVLASDEDATRQDIVDGAGFSRVHEILTRFYRLVLIDTGNNIRTEHFLAATESADQLVIPVAASRDSARPAFAMMKALTAAGHADLVANAVVLIHDLEAQNDADATYLETVREIATEFEGRVSAVVPIPFVAALKGGDEIDYAALSEPTLRAYRDATAAIAGSLRRAALADPRRIDGKDRS